MRQTMITCVLVNVKIRECMGPYLEYRLMVCRGSPSHIC